MRQPALAEGAAADFPSRHPPTEGEIQDPGGLSFERRRETQRRGAAADQPGGWLTEQELSAAIHQLQRPAIVERQDRYVDFGHNATQERRRLDRTEPLGPQGVGEEIDLEESQ